MNFSNGRILLVDDMHSIHEDFRKILVPAGVSQSLAAAERTLFGTTTEPAAAFELDCASSGEEGLRFLQTSMMANRPYELAFVDMRMPAGWDGVRTIEELWREDPQLQVVICTAYSDQPLESALTGLGSADRLLVLKKPFDPIEVSQLAKALVSKRRLAVQAMAQLAHLEQMLNEMQNAATELRRRNQELEAVASAAARELRSPLPIVSRLSALLAKELGTGRQGKVKEYLDQLRESARTGEQLVDGLLSLSEVSRAVLATQSVDLSAMATAILSGLKAREPDRQVHAAVQDGMRAWADPHLAELLLAQLLDNAWKFTRQQDVALITVGSMEGPEGQAIFFVRDSGSGFNASQAGGLFKQFWRVNAADSAGAGVGLVVVGRVVERHGGRVWADSQPSQGTTIYFTIPNPSAVNRRPGREG